MCLHTLRNAAVGAHLRSINQALILIADVSAGFDFHFNDYLHPLLYAQLSIPTQLPSTEQPRSRSLSYRKLFTSSVIIVSSVSGNSLRANKRHVPGLYVLMSHGFTGGGGSSHPGLASAAHSASCPTAALRTEECLMSWRSQERNDHRRA